MGKSEWWHIVYHLANLAIKITSPHGSLGIFLTQTHTVSHYQELYLHKIYRIKSGANGRWRKISEFHFILGHFSVALTLKTWGKWFSRKEHCYRPSQNWWHVWCACLRSAYASPLCIHNVKWLYPMANTHLQFIFAKKLHFIKK